METKKLKYEQTLCWSCRKATGFCSWSDEFIPVKGWVAKPTTIKRGPQEKNPKPIYSYIVRECPEYEIDPPRKRGMR